MKGICTSKTRHIQYISLWLTQQMQRCVYVSQTLLSQQMLQSCPWHRRLLSPQICILGGNFRTTDTTVPTEPHLLAELLFHILFCLQQLWETARTTGISVTANLHLQGILNCSLCYCSYWALSRDHVDGGEQQKQMEINVCWTSRSSLPLPKYSTHKCCVWECIRRRKRITLVLLPSRL